MIGVVAGIEDLETAQEFFELFKTPWERAVPGRRYDVIVTSEEGARDGYASDHVVVYSAIVSGSGDPASQRIEGPAQIQWSGRTFSVFGEVALFQGTSAVDATCLGRSIDVETRRGGRTIRRVGYDLFAEVRLLLTEGQSSAEAANPTLEMHIALLRSLLAVARVAFVEVPPR